MPAPKENDNAVKHSMYAVAHHGAEALPDSLRGRELEMVQNLATYDGALRELERQAGYQLLIVEAGAAYLRELLDDGRNPWTCGKDGAPAAILGRLGSYMNGAVRTLAQLAQLRGDRDVLEYDYEAKIADKAGDD